jgi:hypothetical protein
MFMFMFITKGLLVARTVVQVEQNARDIEEAAVFI